MTVRCRIAPSPTGPLHVGTARTALFNYLFARHHGGTFVLRLEDTDVARSAVEHERDILDGLHWLGLDWDEGPEVAGRPAVGPFGPYRQMERLDAYGQAAERLLQVERAYECFGSPYELAAERAAQEARGEDPRYSGRCGELTATERAARRAEGRLPAIRFRIGTGTVTFTDLVKGPIAIDADALGGDLVIVRSDGTPLYHFTVVVDDAAMMISHVIRGEDHLSNTPKHILLFRALGADVPAFGHLPLILNPDRTKMSKRKSQTAVAAYRAEGFVPEAFVNHLALLGWSSGTEDEVFEIAELVERFDLDRVQAAGAVFDRAKLEWLNGQWIRRLPDEELVERALPFLDAAIRSRIEAGARGRVPTADDLRPLLPMLRERLPLLSSIGALTDYLFLDDLDIDPAQLVPKRWDRPTTVAGLRAARETIEAVGRVAFEAEELEPPLRALADGRGWKPGDLFMAIRVAVTGRSATPPLFDTLVAIGRDRTLDRLDAAAALLEADGT
jgi:glutamyl-tRNA synthetase